MIVLIAGDCEKCRALVTVMNTPPSVKRLVAQHLKHCAHCQEWFSYYVLPSSRYRASNPNDFALK